MSYIRAREGIPPPVIGKAGNYTVFITPTTTRKTPPQTQAHTSPSFNLSASLPAKTAPFTSAKVDSTPKSKLEAYLPTKSPPLSPAKVVSTPNLKLSACLPPKSPPLTPLGSEKLDSVSSSSLSASASPRCTASPPPPVQVPPQQFEKSKGVESSSAFDFFWNAVSKVQNVHSNLDQYLADWLGLNHSKYQWALNDYYEIKGMDKGGRSEELSSKESV